MTLKALLKVIPEPERFFIVLLAYGNETRTLTRQTADDLQKYRTLPVVEVTPTTIYLDLGVKYDKGISNN